jgi:hypothetical protein
VLQLCHSECAVRHAIISLASLHEGLAQNGTVSQDAQIPAQNIHSRFAIQQYSKAMSHLRSWKPPPDDKPSALPLLVCILFVYIEFLMDNETTSQLHIRQGREILSRMSEFPTSSSSPELEIIKSDLVPIYTRLSLTAFLFGSRAAAIPANLRRAFAVPAAFQSAKEARGSLHALMDEALQFSTRARPVAYSLTAEDSVREELAAEQAELLGELCRWNTSFSVFLAVGGDQGSISRFGIDLLQVYYQTTHIWLSTALSPFETSFDRYIPSFASIVGMASCLVHSISVQANSSRGTTPSTSTNAHSGAKVPPSFTFETELIAPLYYTVIKCRHPMIRRAALGLLRHESLRGRRENLWDAGLMAAVAARYIELEESGHPTIEMTDSGEISNTEIITSVLKLPLDGAPTMPLETARSLEVFSLDSLPILSQALPVSDQVDANHQFLTSGVSEVMDDSTYPSQPGGTKSFQDDTAQDSCPNANSQITQLESPFNIPESARIKNALVGPNPSNGRCIGSWVMFFREPDEGASMEWHITREHILVG